MVTVVAGMDTGEQEQLVVVSDVVLVVVVE